MSANGTVDLFGWSTAATTYGIYNSDDNSTYSGDFVDWGATIGEGWRTLTGGSGGEWEYLFNTRTVNGGTGEGKSYTLDVSVNGVSGVVLYPDDYTGELYTTAQSDDWSSFESAGCVFLPAAGGRNGASVIDGGSGGYYWSSTANDTGKAYNVHFGSGSVDPASSSLRGYGFSVRLVRDVE